MKIKADSEIPVTSKRTPPFDLKHIIPIHSTDNLSEMKQKIFETPQTITYIYDNIEVKLTGRYADKKDRSNNSIRIVEIEAMDEINVINLTERWVPLNLLAKIQNYNDDEKSSDCE